MKPLPGYCPTGRQIIGYDLPGAAVRWRRGRSAGEVVPGFLDRLAQRGVTGQRVAGDADGSRGDVDVDAGDAGKLADLGPDGAGTVVAGHPGDGNGTSGHDRDLMPRRIPASPPGPARRAGPGRLTYLVNPSSLFAAMAYWLV